jgi:hypothetical protein
MQMIEPGEVRRESGGGSSHIPTPGRQPRIIDSYAGGLRSRGSQWTRCRKSAERSSLCNFLKQSRSSTSCTRQVGCERCESLMATRSGSPRAEELGQRSNASTGPK